jgi:hypothetical protein
VLHDELHDLKEDLRLADTDLSPALLITNPLYVLLELSLEELHILAFWLGGFDIRENCCRLILTATRNGIDGWETVDRAAQGAILCPLVDFTLMDVTSETRQVPGVLTPELGGRLIQVAMI